MHIVHTIVSSFLAMSLHYCLYLQSVRKPIPPHRMVCTSLTVIRNCQRFRKCVLVKIANQWDPGLSIGQIARFSRLSVYLCASNNNKASTVLHVFEKAVNEYGMPSRVRFDKGVGNEDVSCYMLNRPQRGPGRGSMITGIPLSNAE